MTHATSSLDVGVIACYTWTSSFRFDGRTISFPDERQERHGSSGVVPVAIMTRLLQKGKYYYSTSGVAELFIYFNILIPHYYFTQ